MTTWECSECSEKNRASGRFCAQCGSPRNPALSSAPTRAPEPFVPPWAKPGYVLAKPEDRCTEEGCTKTVAEHMAECRALSGRIGTAA